MNETLLVVRLETAQNDPSGDTSRASGSDPTGTVAETRLVRVEKTDTFSCPLFATKPENGAGVGVCVGVCEIVYVRVAVLVQAGVLVKVPDSVGVRLGVGVSVFLSADVLVHPPPVRAATVNTTPLAASNAFCRVTPHTTASVAAGRASR